MILNASAARRQTFLCALALFAACACASAQTGQSPMTEAPPFKLTSPGGGTAVTFALGEDGSPAYTVSYAGATVIASSTLGLEFKRGGLLSKGLRVTGVRRGTHDETYALVAGKAREARDRYAELIVSLEETVAPRRKLEVIFRAYDDGAAFRYRLPPQDGLDDFELTAERTNFIFPTDLDCWALQLAGFKTSYEGEFDRLTSSRIGRDATLGLPLVCKTRDRRVTFALAEADLKDYAGMHFAGLARGYGVTSRLSPRRDDASVAVRGSVGRAGFVTPWRVVMMSDEPSRLIESTLITNLNPPGAFADTSWVRPGKASWDWWSGQLVEGAPFKKGMNDQTMRAYIDLAAEMGLEYMLVDAGWYSPRAYGEDADYKADITKTIPEIDLAGLVSYARSKGVGLWVWIHWRLANDQMDAAFPFYERLGIKGVKIDFMDSDDQPMVEFYHRVLRKAAEHHLLVDLHGAYKPTGLTRTYPNYLTQEGVMGAEYNKWSARVTATHNVTLAFTRMLLGPMDYTPGAFRNRTPRDFEIHYEGPQVMTTRAQQLAMYVVYESPFACVSDSPGAYRNQAGADFLRAVPTSWDETRALGGDVGEYVVVARRRGVEWYVGVLNNEREREVEVPLSFLGGGAYRLTLYADGATPSELAISSEEVRGGRLKGAGSVRLKLAPGGGAALRFGLPHPPRPPR